MAAYNLIAGIMADENNDYGLLGENCVDFVRDVLMAAGLGDQVSPLMQWVDAAVNHYAAISDWLLANGFGDIWGGIGDVLGAFGELGSLMINAASDAWNWASDMASNAWDFVGSLGGMVGGFFGELANAISNFFGLFGITDTPGHTLPEADGARAFDSDDDFLLQGSDWSTDAWSLTSADTLAAWNDEPTVVALWVPANDDLMASPAAPVHVHDDLLFA